jgi:hypothetical protein
MTDSQVITLISNSLESQLFETFYNETTLELWQENNHSQIYQLKKEIAQI